MKTNFLLLLLCLALFQCSKNGEKLAGGSGTDVGNPTITGTLTNSDGSAASGAKVQVLGNTYNPLTDSIPDSLVSYTDSLGNFQFTNLDSGIYSLEAFHPDYHTRWVASNVSLLTDSVQNIQGILTVPGVVKVPLTNSEIHSEGFIGIPHTSIIKVIDSISFVEGFILLDSIPEGKYDSLIFTPKENQDSFKVIDVPVDVTSEDTLKLNYYSEWNFSKTITWDLSLSNVNRSSDIYNFPLLLRLSNTNFDFTQAKSKGEDLRFTKMDDTPIPYEIETWENNSAAIWILIDSLKAGESSKKFTMYWGQSDATDQSNGENVFKAPHFTAVWHMNEVPNRSSSVKDHSQNQNHLTAFGDMGPTNSVNGYIGKAVSFDGVDDQLRALANEEGPFSVSLWIKADSLGQSEYTGIFSSFTGVPDSNNWQFDIHETSDSYRWNPDRDTVAGNFPMVPVSLSYLQLAITYDLPTIILYVNGSPTDTIAYNKDLLFWEFNLGGNRHGNKLFYGRIDETRISNVALSPQRVQMNYENESGGINWVTIGN